MTSEPRALGPIATVMAREHQAIAAQVEAASRALLVPDDAERALRRAATAVDVLRRHMAVEERLLFGRPVLLDAAYAADHLRRDHGLVSTLLPIIDSPSGASVSTVDHERRPLHVLAALRRLHHLLEHHDQREVDGICGAVDAALAFDVAATVAAELTVGFAATGSLIEAPQVGTGDVHSATALVASATPGPYVEALWRHAIAREPLALPQLTYSNPARRRAIEAACAALDALLEDSRGVVNVTSVDQALRIDRLVSRRDPG